ncbi:hypothetical protein FRB99_004937 [Tulasnella sp. 403]|nr:hypothetical protein FRB99_004937 [Tulasnella sp. 403]
MVALSRPFVVLLLSSLVAAKFGQRHHHVPKRVGLQRRATGPDAVSKRAVCGKRIAKNSSVLDAVVPAVNAAINDAGSVTTSNIETDTTTTSEESASSTSTSSTHAASPTRDNGKNDGPNPSKGSGSGTFVPSKPSSGSWWKANSDSNQKVVIAHFIVGNAYSYSPSQWASEIKMASAQGIDAFALNIGYDSWQPDRVQDAYNAAAAAGFNMLFSFDMTVLRCDDNDIIKSNIAKYHSHPAQLKDGSGASIVTTFDGGQCKSSADWSNDMDGIPTRFIPAFFNDLTNNVLKTIYPVIGGDLLWGGAWPKGNNVIDWSEDAYRISRDGINRAAGDLYVTTVSPWFFAHYPGKNYIWHFDDYLYAKRWEDLFSHRDQVDIVEIVSWNDYGESTYIGPIGKDQPGSQAWVTGFDHTAWLEMTGYYAAAFKTGVKPTITADKIFIWGRPHGVDDGAPDGLGKPDRSSWTTDKLWVVLFSTGPGSLTVTQGPSSTTTGVKSGVNKISLPLGVAEGVTAVLTRDGQQVFSFSAPISFGNNPPSYNFNANVAAGP